MNKNTQCTWHWASAGIKGRLWNTSFSFFKGDTDRNARSMAKRRSVSFPILRELCNLCNICNLRHSLPKGTSTLHPLQGAMGTLWERYANAAMLRERVSKSWIPKSQTQGTPSLPSRTRVKNPSSGKLKARHHRLAHQSMALGVEVSESDSLDWEETSTLDAMNS